ncbi:ABC transporter permease [Noviherbaspirillum galbum]|uniref:Histidine/lysine/arginine/ornithine transport system permease protein HisM n=1 Tax=Noviherbaspirillum galbum TaxID=2709383 RepID=A0A6B3SJM8_9BURK|nr:ABC transporter permease [Noviherbaspirillum galbum]NEX59555.1 ABC transporter permease [Noviherbaspirillum galbum]
MTDLLQEYWRAYLWTDGTRLTGLAVTMWMLVLSTGIGFALAVPLAIARVSPRRWLSLPVHLYTYVFRGTPLYVQLLLIYSGIYGLQIVRETELLNLFFRVGFNCVILAFVLNTCAYTTEILAGAIRSVSHGAVEAGRAYGMSDAVLYRRIILPDAFRRSIPALSNEVIFMLHGTSVAFAATVPDLLKIARDANADTFRSFEAFGFAGLLYLLATFFLVWLFRKAEQRWLRHVQPHHAA